MRVKDNLSVLHVLKVRLILILALNLLKLVIFVLLEPTMNLLAVHCLWSALLALLARLIMIQEVLHKQLVNLAVLALSIPIQEVIPP